MINLHIPTTPYGSLYVKLAMLQDEIEPPSKPLAGTDFNTLSLFYLTHQVGGKEAVSLMWYRLSMRQANTQSETE